MTRERLPSGLPVKPGHATIGIEHPEYGIISIDEPLAELVSRLWTLRIETRSSCQGCPCGGVVILPNDAETLEWVPHRCA